MRLFWAGSYGQIHPELRRLEAEGLIVGEDASNGARSRLLAWPIRCAIHGLSN